MDMHRFKMPWNGFLPRGILFLCNIWNAAAVATPYIPTHIFPSQVSNSSLLYILQPNSGQSAVELLSLNSSTINSSSPQYTVLYNDVPFFMENEAFVPLQDSENGSTVVFAGSCRASQNVSLLWSFQPHEDSPIGNGTWSSSSVNEETTTGTTKNTTGPGYLARGFAFASSNDTRPEFYTFGGMCPFDNSTQEGWMSAAEYSNEMKVLAQVNSSSNTPGFIEQQTGSLNSPIAEAGYTITPLQMTSSTTSAGETVQQENFLFIGGNTKTAFLNMSTLALFSLPQASWTYVTISSDVVPSRTELAVRSNEIEPRSGHSAVLSSDGSKVIILGGWVGDISTPAEPQLLILEVSGDYGGSGDWSWSAPEPTGSGLATGSGIFGHASAMLSGDVMIISGGYSISETAATSKRASASLETNSQVYLYNLTSNAWISSYNSPESSSTNASSQSTGVLASSGEKAGLGVGVSAGAIALVCVSYFVWSRKRWQNRRRRDQQLRKLALGAERSNIWNEPGLESSYRGGNDATLRDSILENIYNTGQSHHYSAVPLPDHGNKAEAERSGLLYDVPSPSRGLRRNLSSRPHRVQSASYYEDTRNTYSRGSIHPIDEREEFETPPEELERESEREGSSSSRASDPFVDPSSPAHISLTAFNERLAGQQEGRETPSVLSEKSRSISPDKGERTHSDLSESSRSGISELSIQRSDLGSQRQPSHLQSAIPTLVPSIYDNAASGRSSPEKASLHAIRAEIAGSGTRLPFDRSDSFSTSASQRRRSLREADTLLGSGPEWATPPESPSRQSDRESRHSNNNSINSNNNNPSSLRWMGSIRKTLSSARRAVLRNNQEDDNDAIAATMLDIKSPVDFDNESLDLSRRASSASVSHLRRKQGPKDWAVQGTRNSFASSSLSAAARRRPRRDDDDNIDNDAFNDEMDTTDLEFIYDDDGDDDDDHEDWDVEAAAEGRSIQITYTVPKERLRVVNAGTGDRVIGDHDDDGDDSNEDNRGVATAIEALSSRPQQSK